MTIINRRLTAADTKAYRAIRLESLKAFPDNFGADYDEQRQLPKLKFEQILEDPQQQSFMIGAFDGAELIGICGFLDFHPNNTFNLQNTGIVIQMYVRPAYSGRKAGLTMLNTLVKEAFQLPSIDQIYLEVVEGNLSAIRVYEQAGFQIYDPPEPQNDNTRRMIIHK